MSFGKIGERTFWDQQGLESSEYVAYRSWDKTVPNAGHVNEILSAGPEIQRNSAFAALCVFGQKRREGTDVRSLSS
jgi:hypothetical protein